MLGNGVKTPVITGKLTNIQQKCIIGKSNKKLFSRRKRMEELIERYVVETDNEVYCVEGKLNVSGDFVSFTEVNNGRTLLRKDSIVEITKEAISRTDVTTQLLG